MSLDSYPMSLWLSLLVSIPQPLPPKILIRVGKYVFPPTKKTLCTIIDKAYKIGMKKGMKKGRGRISSPIFCRTVTQIYLKIMGIMETCPRLDREIPSWVFSSITPPLSSQSSWPSLPIKVDVTKPRVMLCVRLIQISKQLRHCFARKVDTFVRSWMELHVIKIHIDVDNLIQKLSIPPYSTLCNNFDDVVWTEQLCRPLNNIRDRQKIWRSNEADLETLSNIKLMLDDFLEP